MDTLKIGQLAKRVGVSIRTLHYYEEIGLLRPAKRTASNHRVYDQQHVEQLLKIRTMQQLGFDLHTIKALINQNTQDNQLFALLKARHQQALEQRRQLDHLCDKLEQVIHTLESSQSPSLDTCIDTLEAMNMTNIFDKYYTEAQLDTLEQRHQQFSKAELKEVEQAWSQLFAFVRQAIDDGIDPSHERCAAFAQQHKRLLEMFSGGDANIEQAASRVIANHGDELQSQHNQHFDPEVMTFLAQARQHHT